MHLGHLGTRRLTLRRAIALVTHLPDDSATVTAMREDQAEKAKETLIPPSEWPLTDQLLGGILDATRAGNWQRGGGKGSRPASVLESTKRIKPVVTESPAEAKEILRRAARGDG